MEMTIKNVLNVLTTIVVCIFVWVILGVLVLDFLESNLNVRVPYPWNVYVIVGGGIIVMILLLIIEWEMRVRYP